MSEPITERERLIARVSDRLNRGHDCGECNWQSDETAADVIDMILGKPVGTVVVIEKSASFNLEGCKELTQGTYLLYAQPTETK